MIYYKICRVRCRHCGDVLEHVNRTELDNHPHLLRCSCGRVALDPSATLYRVLGEPEDYEDTSEEWVDIHGSYIRRGDPASRKKPNKRLRDFLDRD